MSQVILLVGIHPPNLSQPLTSGSRVYSCGVLGVLTILVDHHLKQLDITAPVDYGVAR